MANLEGIITTLLFSQTTWILLYLTAKFPNLTSPLTLLVFGFLSYAGVAFVMMKLLPPSETETGPNNPNIKQRGLLYYSCCMFSWFSVIDMIFYLEVMGVVNGFLGFYLVTGEPYFGTPMGTLAFLWDAVMNLAFELRIIYNIDNGIDCRNEVLFWSANILASVFCILVGGNGGSYGSNIHPSSWLNISYIVLPLYFCFQIFGQPRYFNQKSVQVNKTNHKSFHYLLATALCVVMIFGFVRGLAALGSPLPIASYYASNIEPYLTHPDKFGAVWVILLMCFGSFVQAALIFGLLNRGAEWMLDWSLLYSGATVFSSFLMFAQFCTGMESEYRPPDDAKALVIVGNLLVPAVALAVTFACFLEPDYFRRPSTKRD